MTRFGEIMEKTGESPYSLAKEVGVTAATIYGWMKGNHRPRILDGIADKVIRYFAINHDILLSYTDFCDGCEL